MNQLKPMIIVLIMLTSVLAGCTGTDEAEEIPGPQGETGEQGPPGIQGETGTAGADLTGVYWHDTTCPDGTNSDENGDTCENNL